MKCDICSEEFGDSKELQKHMALVHPAGEGTLESPDRIGDTLEESAAVEVAQPTH